MHKGTLRVCVGLAVLSAAGVAARGNIANGDFSTAFGVPGWQKGPVINAVAEIVGGRLHLRTEQEIMWETSDAEWLDIVPSFTRIFQDVPADGGGFYAPPGTTGLQFDATVEVFIDGAAVGGAEGFAVFVDYYVGPPLLPAQVREPAPENDGLPVGTGTYLIPMPDLDPDGGPITIGIAEDPAYPSGLDTTTTHSVVIEGWLDNFQFTGGVIPEPATALTAALGLLAAGSVGVRRVRGRG